MHKGRKSTVKEIDKVIEEIEHFLDDTPEDLEVGCI
jgi:chaperonin cofactor prefoldin